MKWEGQQIASAPVVVLPIFLEADSGTINGVRNESARHAPVKPTPRDCEAIGSLFVFGTYTERLGVQIPT